MVLIWPTGCQRAPDSPERLDRQAPPPDAGQASTSPLAFPPREYPAHPPASAKTIEALGLLLKTGSQSSSGDAKLRSRFEALGETRLAPLLSFVEDPELSRPEKLLALLALQWLPDRRSAPQLARLSLELPDPLLVAAAADALAATGDPRGVAALETLSRRPDPVLRRRAVMAIGALGAGGLAARTAARQALRRLASHPDARIRGAVMVQLGVLGAKDDCPWFLSALSDSDMLVRRRAAEGLARHADRLHLAALSGALKDPFGPVAVAAARGLERLEDPAALPALYAYLAGQERAALDPTLRALQAIGDARAIPHVAPLLDDRDGYLRAAAAKTLGALGGVEAAGPLRRALRGDMVIGRIAAAEALARLGKDAREALDELHRAAKDDPHPQVRELARVAVRAIGEGVPRAEGAHEGTPPALEKPPSSTAEDEPAAP